MKYKTQNDMRKAIVKTMMAVRELSVGVGNKFQCKAFWWVAERAEDIADIFWCYR